MMKLLSLILAGGAGYWLAKSGLVVPNNLSQTEQNLVNAYRSNVSQVTGAVTSISSGASTISNVVTNPAASSAATQPATVVSAGS